MPAAVRSRRLMKESYPKKVRALENLRNGSYAALLAHESPRLLIRGNVHGLEFDASSTQRVHDMLLMLLNL